MTPLTAKRKQGRVYYLPKIRFRRSTIRRQRAAERGGDFADQLGGGGVAIGSLLEEEEGGHGFASDFQGM